MFMLQAIIGPVANLLGTYIGGKMEKAKAETEAKISIAKSKSKIAEKVASGEMEWNQTMAEASKDSLKDEWLTILVSIPLLLAFTGHEDIVMRGFKALEQMPDFYKTAVGVVFAASFGVNKLTQMFRKK